MNDTIIRRYEENIMFALIGMNTALLNIRHIKWKIDNKETINIDEFNADKYIEKSMLFLTGFLSEEELKILSPFLGKI